MSKNFLFSALLLLFVVLGGNAQELGGRVFSMGFYNVENLFDTIHDAGKNDYEFLPDGTYRWGTKKYLAKLCNIATVISEMGRDFASDGVLIVGLAEVENVCVLRDLVQQPMLVGRWDFVHVESVDKRGIDCALLYKKGAFLPLNVKLVPFRLDGVNGGDKRGFLVVNGLLGDDEICVIVNHWPSRSSKSSAREQAAGVVRGIMDSVAVSNPAAKIVVMGDFNDNPNDRSVAVVLNASDNIKNVVGGGLYNPWGAVYAGEGRGTLLYRKKWNLFDQILLSDGFLRSTTKGLRFYKAEIFERPYLYHDKGRYEGQLKRTHAGGVWYNGYSDHLPVVVYIINGE